MTQATAPEAAETVTSGQDTGFIDDPRDLGNRIMAWKEKGYHVLSPAIQISNFAPGYGVNASMVLLDYNVDPSSGAGVDVYFDKATMNGKGDNRDGSEQRGVSKIGLNKIASAAGVSWVKGERVDPLVIQNLWIYRVLGVYLAYDGTPQTIPGEKEIDYRDGSAQIGEWSREAWDAVMRKNDKVPAGQQQKHINGWSDRRVRNARTNGAERAETGAMERAIRTLGIKHVYTITELKRPFVALRVCPIMDMTDPAVRRMVAEGQMGGVAKLYAQQHQPRQLEAAQDPVRFSTERLRPAVAEPLRQEMRQDPDRPAAATAPVQPPQQPPQQRQQDPDRPGAVQPRETVEKAIDATFNAVREAAQPRDARQELPPGALLIVDVQKADIPYNRNHKKYGQKFTKWTVSFSDSTVAETVFHSWGKVIDDCWDGERRQARYPVRVRSLEKEFHGRYTNEVDSIEQWEPSPDDGDDLPYGDGEGD